jgi:tetratricopeptide (TPR) repeat protein
LARLGRHEDAVQHLADAVRLAPESADNNWRLALELRNLGREREAAVALRRCLEIDPNHTQGRILEIEQLALNAPERDGQFEEIAPFEADRTEPQISDQLLRRATAGRAASRDAAVLARAEATRPVSLFAQPWFLVVQAVALVLLALWLRTLFP